MRGILANWVLAGIVIAGFGVIMTLGPGVPVDVDSSNILEDVSEDATTTEPGVSSLEAPPTDAGDLEDTILDDPVAPPSQPASETLAVFPGKLALCGSMSISNRPAFIQGLDISNYQPTISVNGVAVAVAPVEAACFSSGFGPRGSSIHKGIDLHNSQPVQVYAAATGTVKEKQYRDDYGNMLVLDHGNGVYTRYAHLESFADGLEFAETVTAGAPIGIMGNTASYSIPRHLHYELMTGEWGALSGSFGLTAINIMAQLPDN